MPNLHKGDTMNARKQLAGLKIARKKRILGLRKRRRQISKKKRKASGKRVSTDILENKIQELRSSIIQKYNNLKGLQSEKAKTLKSQYAPIISPLEDIKQSNLQIQKQIQDERHRDYYDDADIIELSSDDSDSISEENKPDDGGEQLKDETIDEQDVVEEGEEDIEEEESGDESNFDNSMQKLLNESMYVGKRFSSIADMLKKYLEDFHRLKRKSIAFGLQFNKNTNSFYLGKNISVRWDYDHIIIGETIQLRIKLSRGLLELLFKSKPNVSMITITDFRNYKKILLATNIHLDNRGNLKKTDSIKSKLIQKLFLEQRKSKRGTHAAIGKGLSFVKNVMPNRTYIYWDNVNELVSRLEVLINSTHTGHDSHEAEISSILEELKERGYIL